MCWYSLRCAAGAVACLFILTGQAQSADLGGDCCAELEERIAELEATAVRKGNRNVSLKIYGQVNQAVMFWDDGIEDNVYIVTNQTTKNLLGFEGSAPITPEVKAGYRLEIEVRNAASDFVDQGGILGFPDAGVGDAGDTRLFMRQSNWWVEHEKLGRVTVGLGSNATDGIAEIDLSGSTAAAGSAVEAWNEGFFLVNKDTGVDVTPVGGTGIGVFVDIFRGNFDGGRGNLVRYDTPVIAGFIASAAWGEDDDWDVALRYDGDIGDFHLRAGIGYHEGKITDSDNFQILFGDPNAINDHNEVTGSASVLHTPTGLFLTVAAGSREWPDTALIGEKYFYTKTGIFTKWSDLGKTSIYGEYYHVWDVGLNPGTVANIFGDVCDSRCNESGSVWGVGIVQHIDAASMELYASYRHYWANDVTDVFFFDDNDVKLDVVMTGARVRF